MHQFDPELLRRSQQIARIGNWEVDLVRQEVYWDEMTRTIHEVGPDFVPTVAMGLRFYKEGTSREVITRLFSAAVERGEPYDTELQLLTETGQEIWVRAIGQAEFKDGKCIRVYGIFQDIDVRRRSEERALNYSILEAKSREMEQFAYVASHDLREPLLTIKGYLQVIQEDFGTQLHEEVTGYLQTVADAAERMDTVIKGLLDYSRLSKIKQLQPVSLVSTLEEIMEDLASVIKQSNAFITYTDLPDVMGYPLEMKILLQNLLSNAIKYRRVDVPLRIEVTCADLPGGWEIKVTDNGIGIAKKNLKHIFRLFQQLHSKGTYSGNGIGLANCQKIVELHGGDIWAESVLGEGSSIHFTILTRGEEVPAAPTSAPHVSDDR